MNDLVYSCYVRERKKNVLSLFDSVCILEILIPSLLSDQVITGSDVCKAWKEISKRLEISVWVDGKSLFETMQRTLDDRLMVILPFEVHKETAYWVKYCLYVEHSAFPSPVRKDEFLLQTVETENHLSLRIAAGDPESKLPEG